MPEPTPPGDAGGAAGRPAGPLTPQAIDAVLADFRRWLEELVLGEPAASASEVLEPPVADAPCSPAVDLATLVAAFTALRHEVNLQTKATRIQSEQFATVLETMQRPAAANGDDVNRPLVKAVVEAYDTLTRTTSEIERLRTGTSEPPSFWRRLLSFLSPPPQGGREMAADRLAAAATGLRMSERRVERLMSEVGLEPVEAVGRPFDPEAMEAVEVVTAADHSPGTVVDELRRGYRWRGRVFRFAQVRVAK